MNEPDGPSHPAMKATLLMIGVVVFLVAISAASVWF